jgi:hypothetical protein
MAHSWSQFRPGTYKVEVETTGFKRMATETIEVTAGSGDIKLKLNEDRELRRRLRFLPGRDLPKDASAAAATRAATYNASGI